MKINTLIISAPFLLLTLDILSTFYLNANNFSFLPGKYNNLLGSLPPAAR